LGTQHARWTHNGGSTGGCPARAAANGAPGRAHAPSTDRTRACALLVAGSTHTPGVAPRPAGEERSGAPAPYTSAATAASTAATASDTPFALPGSGAAVVLPLVGVAVVGAAVVEPGYTMFSCVQTDV